MSVLRELGILVLVGLIAAVNGVLSTWYTWNNQIIGCPLHDVLFDLFPDLSHWTIPIPNYVYLAQVVVALLAFPYDRKVQYFAQYIFLQCILTSVRALTVCVTILPNIHVDDYCKEDPTGFFDVVGKIIGYGTCGDYMWSGHTACVFALFLFVHNHKEAYGYELVSGILFGTMILFLILLRWHYTIDIIIGTLITWLSFNMYTRYERHPSLQLIYFRSFRCGKKRRDKAGNKALYKPLSTGENIIF